MSNDRKYKLVYTIEGKPDGVTKDEVPQPYGGATDAILVASVLFDEEGGTSTMFITCDGRTEEEMGINDVFKVWTMLAKTLSESDELGPTSRLIAGNAFGMVQRIVLANRAAAQEEKGT